MLFSLACPESVPALTKLYLRYCRIIPEGMEFAFSAPRKRGSSDQLSKASFAQFPSNSRFLIETVCSYLKATCVTRPASPSSRVDPLFMSYVKPHKPITAPSTERWPHLLLKVSGVNTNIFKAHSVCGALTTTGANSNVPVSEILRRANWPTPSTFLRFHYKPDQSNKVM